MCCSQVVQTGLGQGYMTWLTGRGRRESHGVWLVDYLKGAQGSEAISLVYLGSSSLPTKKWRDVLWNTHLWAAFDVPFYSPGLCEPKCVSVLKKFCSAACKINGTDPSVVGCFTEQPQTLPPSIPLDIMLFYLAKGMKIMRILRERVSCTQADTTSGEKKNPNIFLKRLRKNWILRV